jgi:uncharacterized damage-inducible protein DinB
VTEREVLTLGPIAGAGEVDRWLAAMQDGRRDTLREVDGVTDDIIDLHPPGAENSIGTTLYHVALIEADWLVDDILGTHLGDSELAPLFPVAHRDDRGILSHIAGEPLSAHLARLAEVRAFLLEQLRPMPAEDFHAPRARPDYDVSPAWVVHHLLQHEAEHRSEIGWLKRQLVRI